ncbi:MAG: cyanophycinase [Bacteroidales bacterium]|nr:cyanophycinase [Bacteroidales bacterium]
MQMFLKSAAFFCLFLMFFWACNTKSNQDFNTGLSNGPSNGHLIVAGGNLTDTAVFNQFMLLAGGPEAPIVIVVSAMTDDDISNPEFYTSLSKWWRNYGFRNFTFLHTRNRDTANSEHFTEAIRKASGVWFMGGRQWRLVDAYFDTKTLDEFYAVLDRGGVIGGSSAGASIQGSYLARGDTKTNTLMMGDHEEGFGFISNVAIDQHLLAMNRQFDIFEILDAHPGMLGLGLDENTAIVVHGNEFEVVGQSYVAVYDGTFYREVRDKDDWSQVVGEVTELPSESRKFYFIKNGQRYNLKLRKVIKEYSL